jgi:hypothetical protein
VFDAQHTINIDLPIDQVAEALNIPNDDEVVTLD